MKLYILILLFCINTALASSEVPPPLPTFEVSTDSSQQKDQISLIQKLKNFFGFGEKKKLIPVVATKKDDNELASHSGLDPESHEIVSKVQDDSKESFIDVGENKLPKIDNIPHDDEQAEITKQSQREDIQIPTVPLEFASEKAPEPISEKPKEQPASPTTPEGPDSSKSSSLKETEAISVPTLPAIPQAKTFETPTIPVVPPSMAENTDNKPEPTAQSALNSELPKPATLLPATPPTAVETSSEKLKPAAEIVVNPELAKFVSDETKLLLLPNDEIVLGILSEGAKIELMDYSVYIDLFKHELEHETAFDMEENIDSFIATYNDNYNSNVQPPASKVTEASKNAFNAVSKDNLSVLRVMLDNYPILDKRDKEGNTLLHKSAEMDSYYLTKFLLMRGINILATNIDHETALMIARQSGNNDVTKLLRRAGSK